MSKINAMDLSFLLLENATRRMHMTAFMLFKKPAGQQATFVPRLVAAYRASQAAAPFNRKLKWLEQGVAAWQTVKPDMAYHVRSIAIASPGSMAQFYETISFLNTSLLDRGHPLWECYVIDGIEDDRVAVLIKVHHALIDGEGGLQAMRNSLTDSPRSKQFLAPWMASGKTAKPRSRRPSPSQLEKVQGLLQRLAKVPGDLIGMGSEAVNLGAQSLNLKPRPVSLPFSAPRSLFNNTAQSAARAYANIELPLDQVKALSKVTGASVNDVVMTLIDQALHHYLREHHASVTKPLVALMPMSLRDESAGGEGGNQVSAELIAMGLPKASIVERLQQIKASTQAAKDKGRALPKSVRQVYTLLLASSLAVVDTLPFFGKIPSANLVISNMKGPAEQLYMAGAPMVAFHGLPILPPGAGLNITFASVNKDICLAIAAAPEAVHEPYRLATLIEQAFSELQAAAEPAKGKAPRRARKTTA